MSGEKSAFIVEHKSKFETIKHVFHITRLLQDYARIVGPNVDDGKLSISTLPKGERKVFNCSLLYFFSYFCSKSFPNIDRFGFTIYSIFTICTR